MADDWTWRHVVTTAVSVLGVVAVCVALVAAVYEGNERSDRSRERRLRICVEAGGSFHRGDCLRTGPS